MLCASVFVPHPLSRPVFRDLEPIPMERGMQRRIRPLHHRLTVVEFVELGLIHVDRSGDVARLPHLRITWALGIVTRQGIRAIKMEGSSTRAIRGADAVVGRQRRILLCAGGAVGADLAGGDALFFAAEDVACEDVDDAEDYDDDAARDDDLPHGLPEGFLACGFLVQVAEDGDTEDYH